MGLFTKQKSKGVPVVVAATATAAPTSAASTHISKSNDDIAATNSLPVSSTLPSTSSTIGDRSDKVITLLDFLRTEMHRGYVLENDEERYVARRDKLHSLMQIPKEVERFMTYGFLQCFDSFLYVCVFLPYRFLWAFWSLVSRPFFHYTGIHRRYVKSFLTPPEVCDLLKSFLLVSSTLLFLQIDINVIYHLIKFQSVIKLYIIFNILEVGDRLLSCLGQDTIDALFWTATEPKGRSTNHASFLTHLILAAFYVLLHSLLVLFQATTLNVAINSENKALSIIMMANNFVELKGSVFKKFDKNNLFQVACCDVRERFHLFMLTQIVILQTMKEYAWKPDRLWLLLPDCAAILLVEVVVDWIKHAFITRFNDLQVIDIYKEYTVSLAYDMTQIRQKHAFTDQTDLVSRRMGFMPLPIVVCCLRVMYHCLHIDGFGSLVLFVYGFLVLFSCKLLVNILVLGQACDLIDEFEETNKLNGTSQQQQQQQQQQPLPKTEPVENETIPGQKRADLFKDMATSPIKMATPKKECDVAAAAAAAVIEQVKNHDLNATAIFSNSSVDLKNACLNDEVLKLCKDEPIDSDVSAGGASADGLLVSSTSFEAEQIATPIEPLKRSESDSALA